MRSHRLACLLLAVVAWSAACQSTAMIPEGAESARARVSGSVTTPTGTALDRVLVTVHLPAAIYSRGYTYLSGTTGADGRFQADVVRLLVAPVIALPDTITAYVVATESGGQYKAGTDGRFPTDSMPVLIQFWPAHQTPMPSVVQMRLAVP
jgi:hypothetical protein